MGGGFFIEIEHEPAPPSAASKRRGTPCFTHGRVRVWSDEPTIEVDARTIILGHLFTRGSRSTRVDHVDVSAARRLSATAGRSLLTGYWGGYVMVHVEGNGRVRILRDPSGLLPCYVYRSTNRTQLAGDVADLVAPGPGRANLIEAARVIASGDARGRCTGLTNIEELIAGECLLIDGEEVTTECWWSPWDHVDPSPGLDLRNAAAHFRETVDDCIGSWAGCFSSILLGASGGLDSSIVAAAAAPKSKRLTCLTLVGPDHDGDERHYAHQMAAALGLDCLDAAFDLADIDITRPAAAHHPWPIAPFFKQATEAIHRRNEAELEIDAHFSGNGGDAILCSLNSTVPFLDRFLSEGPRPALAATLRDISTLTGADTMTVLRYAWARYRNNGGRHNVRFNGSGLAADLASDIEQAGATHPWLNPPAHVLPGKTAHAAFVMRSQKGIELYPRAISPPHIAPLLSQPIVELCLSIPTWMWVSGGRNRSVARAAFEPLLPAEIIGRTGKGGPGGFSLSIYRQNRAALQEHLRSGILASAGIIDPAFLDIPDDPSWRGTARVRRILKLAAAESWVRWWEAAG